MELNVFDTKKKSSSLDPPHSILQSYSSSRVYSTCRSDDDEETKMEEGGMEDLRDDIATDKTIAEIINEDVINEDRKANDDTIPLIKHSKLCTWKTLDFVVNDLLIVGFSISDIFLDIAVCYQFYTQKRMAFFYMSVAIFFFAQFSYCFLFTATWARHLSPLKKVAVFICTLPLGQLIPFFTWIEAFRFSWIDNSLKWLGLKPTACRGAAHDMQSEEDGYHGGDYLWGYIQTKYQAHAGFLAEALAEAIPQCILQTVAIITSGESSDLFIISITISICVISSKGYLISYSIHRPTFIFNFLCIAADCFGLFATCAWLFDGDGGITNSLSSSKFQLPDDSVSASWLILFLVGCMLLLLGGLCLVVFSMLDDHLKTFNESMWGHFDIDNVFFDIYVVRLLAWIVAVIPVSVIFLTSKLTLIPVCLFNSLDPEHAQHYTFYSSLFRFLTLYKTDMRIAEANKFILQCRRDVNSLSLAMLRRPIEWHNGQRRSPADRRQQELKALRLWLSRVGVEKGARRKASSYQANSSQSESGDDDISALQEAIARALAESFDDTSARAAVRNAHVNYAMQSQYARLKRKLSKRSSIFYELFTDNPDAGDYNTSHLTKATLFYVGMVFMWVGLIAVVMLVPCFLLSSVLGVLFPIIQLIRSLSTSPASSISFVAFFLTVAYSCLIVLLLCMIPLVGEFQLFRTDIVDLKGFPPIFYEVDTVRELHQRFVREVDARLFEKALDTWFGVDIALHIKSYADPECRDCSRAAVNSFRHRVQSVSANV